MEFYVYLKHSRYVFKFIRSFIHSFIFMQRSQKKSWFEFLLHHLLAIYYNFKYTISSSSESVLLIYKIDIISHSSLIKFKLYKIEWDDIFIQKFLLNSHCMPGTVLSTRGPQWSTESCSPALRNLQYSGGHKVWEVLHMRDYVSRK